MPRNNKPPFGGLSAYREQDLCRSFKCGSLRVRTNRHGKILMSAKILRKCKNMAQTLSSNRRSFHPARQSCVINLSRPVNTEIQATLTTCDLDSDIHRSGGESVANNGYPVRAGGKRVPCIAKVMYLSLGESGITMGKII